MSANQEVSHGNSARKPPRPLNSWAQRIPRSARRAALFIVVFDLGLAVAVTASILAVTWYRNRPLPLRDLGAVNLSSVGLKGNLVTKWNERAEYRVSFEPLAEDQGARFGLLVRDPPRPLMIGIVLKDSTGFILCGKQIVLPFDFLERNGPASDSLADRQDYALAAGAAAEREMQWELNRDIFQIDMTNSGRIGSITAEGDIPCSKDAYEQAAQWTFSSNFPTIAEQDAMLKTRMLSQQAARNKPSNNRHP